MLFCCGIKFLQFMPRSGILDASVSPLFTKYALNALAIDFLSFRTLPLWRNSDDNFEHFDLLITCLIIPQVFSS